MKTFPISATYLKMFLQCPQQFYYRYHSDLTPIGLGHARAFGTAVHAALEFMYTVLSKEQRMPVKEDYDKVIEVFNSSAIDYGLDDQELYEEGRDIVRRYLDNFTLEEKVIGLELKFGLPRKNPEVEVFTDGGTAIAGAIDKLVEIDSDTVAIIDYKTSRRAMTRAEAATDEQLSMYDLAISKMYPQYSRRILVLDYIRQSPVISTRSDEQRVAFGKLLDNVNEKISNMKEEDVKPRVNSFCGWCDYRIYCPAYENITKSLDLKVKPVFSLDNDELVEEWTRAEGIKKAIASYMRELSVQAEGISRVKGGGDIVSGDNKLVQYQSTITSYDVGSIINSVPRSELTKVLSVNKKGLKKYMSAHPEEAEKIKDTASTSYASSYFRLKKKAK